MAKHLREADVERVVELLDGWTGKLTWESLSYACASWIGTTPTRQTLASFSRIQGAYRACKQRLKDESQVVPTPPTLKAAGDRIARLEREKERLQRENRGLLEQFVVWQYNAHIRGLSDKDLNQPLPTIDRGRTD